MSDLRGFDARNVEPTADFEPIPSGKYLAMIVSSETKPTKSGNGSYLQLTFQILDGPFKNRLLWARLNLVNANATTVQMAQAELSAICRAIGVMAPNDSVELHNLPLLITVRCKKRADTGEVQNEIRGYAKKEAVNGQAQQAQTGTPPWRRP
jgi:hypothetical protein